MSESATYQSMLEEVEGIVKEMSSSDVELDTMVKKVERGYQLIQSMKERLNSTREMINQLQEKYES